MKYRSGYKYQLAGTELFNTSFRPAEEIHVPRISLFADGVMLVKDGYAWDGASGIVDRKSNLRASLGHDALYQLMRMKALPHTQWAKADEDFCIWLREAGAYELTIKIDRLGLSMFKGRYAHPNQRKPIYII